MKKKIRKPRKITLLDCFEVSLEEVVALRVYVRGGGYIRVRLKIAPAKRLHKWLGRAIAYLEQEKLKAARGGS